MNLFSQKSDFEHYISSEVQSKVLYPSESTWLNIRKRLSKRKMPRWPELMIVGIVTFFLHTAGLLIFKPNYKVLRAPYLSEMNFSNSRNTWWHHDFISSWHWSDSWNKEWLGHWKSFWQHYPDGWSPSSKTTISKNIE